VAEREVQIKIVVDTADATSKMQAFNGTLQSNDTVTKAVAESSKKLDAAFKEADKAADKAAASAAKLGQAHQAAGVDVAALSSKIIQFAGPAVVGAYMLSVARLGSDIQDMSQKLGMAASEFDSLSQMSKEFGIEAGSVVNAMITLQDRVAGGDKSTVAALNKLKINIDEFKASTPDQMFYTLAAAVKELNTHQERIATLSDLGGRSFRQFAGMMSEDLTKLKNELPVFGDATARELDRIAESWDRVWNASKRYAGAAIAALNVGPRMGEAFRESFGPPDLPGPPGKDRSLSPANRNPNEARDLRLGMSKAGTDQMSARPLDWAEGKPGFLPGASASTPGDEFSTQLTGRMPDLGKPPAAFDASAAWGEYWGGVESAAASVPPVIDAITTSTKAASEAFKEMGIMAGIALSVPMGTSMALAYAESGVGSGLGGGAVPTEDLGQQVMTARTKAFLGTQFGGKGAGGGSGGAGGATVNINANGAFFQNDQMIKQLADQVGQAITAAYGSAKKW
jgi:hypothetical protein